MPQCEQIEAKLAAFVEESADKSTRIEVEAHISVCPHCEALVREQRAMRHQLRLLACEKDSHTPSPQLWERASVAWDQQDHRHWRTRQLPMTLAGACLLLLVFSAVWARQTASHEFPTAAVLQDFHNLHISPNPTSINSISSINPEKTTPDADRASRWLSGRLHIDLPPMNLSLTHGELLGADIVGTPEIHIGRLLYRTPQGIVAIYVAPGRTHFSQTASLMVEAHDFEVKQTAEMGMYGWDTKGVGYGMVLAEPINNGRRLAVNAKHDSSAPIGNEQ